MAWLGHPRYNVRAAFIPLEYQQKTAVDIEEGKSRMSCSAILYVTQFEKNRRNGLSGSPQVFGSFCGKGSHAARNIRKRLNKLMLYSFCKMRTRFSDEHRAISAL